MGFPLFFGQDPLLGSCRSPHPLPLIQPNYVDCTITCACGNVIKTRSTKPEIHVEVCSKCHPFYTGKQKLVDTSGRVDKFNKKYGIK